MYFVNGMGGEICILNIEDFSLSVRRVEPGVAAMAYDAVGRMIVSRPDGVFILNDDDSITHLYDTYVHRIQFANDMKVGPDGRLYVGTQSEWRKKVSDKRDGKLYSIDKHGQVRILLDGMMLSNGMDWSMDETRFYHTDSDTHTIREYAFDKRSGDMAYTGREIELHGVDGFTVDREDRLFAASWGHGAVAVIDTKAMKIVSEIKVPTRAPASCGFVGQKLDRLAIVTSGYGADLDKDPNAGYTYLTDTGSTGRMPYLFGQC